MILSSTTDRVQKQKGKNETLVAQKNDTPREKTMDKMHF